MLSLELMSADAAARAVAGQLRALRLQRGWTQAETAERAALTLASYKRFEQCGEIAFLSLLKVALIFGRLDRVQRLFESSPLRTLDDAAPTRRPRVRAPRRQR